MDKAYEDFEKEHSQNTIKCLQEQLANLNQDYANIAAALEYSGRLVGELKRKLEEAFIAGGACAEINLRGEIYQKETFAEWKKRRFYEKQVNPKKITLE